MKCIYWGPEEQQFEDTPYNRSCKNDDGEEMYNRETRQWEFLKYDHLQDAVKRFFEILDTKEESDSGHEWHPVTMDFDKVKIASCRVVRTAELQDLFEQMKILSGYRQEKEMRDWKI